MCQLLLMPRHQKDDHHLSTLLAVLADAFMENDFYHLSTFILYLFHGLDDILAGDNRANRSVSLTPVAKKADIYLSFLGLFLHQDRLAKSNHLFVFLDLW